MIEPAQADDAFLADVDAARRKPDALHLWWLGQSGFLLAWRGRHLLLDPYLSDSLTRKYADTDRPHVRMTRRVVAPERLGFVDVVTSTHNHTDHLDADTLAPILDAGAALVCPAANREFATERLGRAPQVTVEIGERVELLPTLPLMGSSAMSGPEAARAAHDAGARLVVPCHYEMFEFNTARPGAFAAECERLGQPYRVLRAGERLSLSTSRAEPRGSAAASP